jgi:hypothetical protein
MYKKNPIMTEIDFNKSKLEEENQQRKIRNYLDSSLIRTNLEHPHPDNSTFAVNKSELAQIQGKFIVEQSRAINKEEKKFLRNSDHLISGKTGYYL